MRYFILLAYNGTDFHGSQTQPNAISVQQTLEQAMTTILRCPISLVFAGRTDAGVHATQMYAHFDLPEGQMQNAECTADGLIQNAECTDKVLMHNDSLSPLASSPLASQPLATLVARLSPSSHVSGEPLRLSASHPLRLSASHPLRLSASHPLSLSASHPLRLSASHPLRLSASHPLRLSASHPLRLSASQPTSPLQGGPEGAISRLNSLLPPTIAVSAIFPVPPDAHARFSATSRTYEYRVTTAKDPFRTSLVTRVAPGLDFDAMNEAAQLLLGTHDFASFCKVHTDVKTTICTVTRAEWVPAGPNSYTFIITADRFLRNMVRAIVGTLLDIGRAKMTKNDLQHIMNLHNRCAAGQSAPASGLYLVNIEYDL